MTFVIGYNVSATKRSTELGNVVQLRKHSLTDVAGKSTEDTHKQSIDSIGT